MKMIIRCAILLVTAIPFTILHAQQAPDTTNRGVKSAPPQGRSTITTDFEVSGSGASFNGSSTVSAPKFKQGFLGAPATTLGATIGGAKDIGYARNLINAGKVPSAIDFSPEGLYSEHDIPTPASECTSKLCLSLGYGFASTADSIGSGLFVHLGMSTNVKTDEFKRPALQLMVVVDKSGSMEGSKIQALKAALHKLLQTLHPDDQLMMVQFDDKASVIVPLTTVASADLSSLTRIIDSLRADNGTNIEAGLRLGYKELNALPLRDGFMKRLILFTDERPNIGKTDSASFVGMIANNSKENNIGFTLFGIGFDFGQELAYKTSQVRGANFFFLQNSEKIATVFDQEFDFLVTPIVYDLQVNIATPKGLKLTAVYGLPNWKPGDKDAHLEVPTVFFSSNRGAIVLRYEFENGKGSLTPGVEIAEGTISYTLPGGKHEEYVTELRHNATASATPGTMFFTHPGMRTAIALTNIYFGLRDGCRLYTSGKKKEALEAISKAKTLALLDNLSLADTGISNEVDLLNKLYDTIDAETKASATNTPPKSVPVR